MNTRNLSLDPILRYTETIVGQRFLEQQLRAGKKLRMYIGADATGPHLHIGHATNLLLMRWFQEQGHELIFLVGDFTAQIGDPTDKAAVRKPLTPSEVRENMATFQRQVAQVLEFSGSNPARVLYNSAWLGSLKLDDFIRLSQRLTVQQMIERDMFQERLRAGKPIGLHEFIYPLLQGYDSVAMDVDVEVGGSDQLFNMHVGRTLMKELKQKEKVVITTKLLVNPKTGKKLMNKSEGGLINLDDSPADMFGKVMALPDEAIVPVVELCTTFPMDEVRRIEKGLKAKTLHPRDAKFEAAKTVVMTYHGTTAAEQAASAFTRQFKDKEVPTDVTERTPSVTGSEKLAFFLVDLGLASSKSEAMRLIEQGGVTVDGAKITDPLAVITPHDGMLIQVGKRRYVKVKL
ncbi:tyrosine--tRNA ligase [Candidatus Berkelbacteria bacterium]|nr:tyrosine--tRNA ligase [Candidatus Berkelbacteria bacterium]